MLKMKYFVMKVCLIAQCLYFSAALSFQSELMPVVNISSNTTHENSTNSMNNNIAVIPFQNQVDLRHRFPTSSKQNEKEMEDGDRSAVSLSKAVGISEGRGMYATGNDGNHFDAPCSLLGEECAFSNSVCGVSSGLNYTCRCSGIAYFEGPERSCKKIVGASCEKSEDCINYAQCQMPSESSSSLGECNCTSGFTYDSIAPYTCYSLHGNKNGTSLGDACTNRYEPCAFDSSMCVGSDNASDSWSKKCECDSVSINEDSRGRCKKVIGTYCKKAAECIKNTECPIDADLGFGFCSCLKDYTFDPKDLSKCNSMDGADSTTALSVAVLLVSQFISIYGN